MIRNRDFPSKFKYALIAAIILHAAILAFVKYDLHNSEFLTNLSNNTKNMTRPIKLDDIEIIKPSDVEKYRKVGIKNGKKDLQRPDLAVKRPTPPPPHVTPKQGQKGSAGNLSLENLAPDLPKPKIPPADSAPKPKAPENQFTKDFLNAAPSSESGHFYFNPKQQKVIQKAREQEILKEEAVKGVSIPMNKATQNVSNFEIRYERPEGVSEDELNSDEKAYYSFYVRSYQNYYSKIYSTYEKTVVARPGLASVFDGKHLLIGKIDYDEKGNIITVRILKSSTNDDLHYFFEETLKQLNQPNPPRVFTKNRKQFSIFYQLQIN